MITLAGAYLLLLPTSGISDETTQTAKEPPTIKETPTVTAAVIPCKGMIDNGLYKSIRRRTEIALDNGAQYLVYEIGTYGGLVQSADDISKFLILEVGKKAQTVAYVTTEAISAGALVSVACKDIIMLKNTTIGDCAPIQIGGKLEGVEREKAESFVRAAFMRAAEANNYPVALLKAMVSMRIEVYRVQNLQTSEPNEPKFEFFESDELPKDANLYDLNNKEIVAKKDEILTLTASRAHKYGIARTLVDDRSEVFEFLAKRDGVTFTSEPMVLETNWSEEMVRWINSPVATGILMMIALLGIYIELSTPGVGLPGLAAVICFAIIFGSKYLIGLANWVEIALFVTGLLLLMIEIFVTPGFGVIGGLGIICMLAGLFGILIANKPDELPWPKTDFDWDLLLNGVLAFTLGILGSVAAVWLLGKHLPKLQLFSALILTPSTAGQQVRIKASMTAPVEGRAVSVNIGDIGEATSPLRPAGKARFASAIVDVVAEGDFLEKGAKVKIIEIHGNRVVVCES